MELLTLGMDDTRDGRDGTFTFIAESFQVFEASSFEPTKVSASKVSPLNLCIACSFLHVIHPVLLFLSIYDDDSTP